MGVTKYYSEMGTIAAEIPYINDDEIHGTSISYYNNGNKKKENPFVYNIINGIEITYYENGNKKRKLL